MFTGSADPQHRSDESATDVAIGHPTARSGRSRPTRSSIGAGPVDLRDRGAEGCAAAIGADLDASARFEQDEPGQIGWAAAEDAWMVEAACKGRTNLFFGLAGERPERRVRRERTARDVCATCQVVEPCRDRARRGRENGFWGGESEEERAEAGFPPRSISRRSVQQATAVRIAVS